MLRLLNIQKCLKVNNLFSPKIGYKSLKWSLVWEFKTCGVMMCSNSSDALSTFH